MPRFVGRKAVGEYATCRTGTNYHPVLRHPPVLPHTQQGGLRVATKLTRTVDVLTVDSLRSNADYSCILVAVRGVPSPIGYFARTLVIAGRRIVGTVMAAGLLVFVAIEASIPGGFRTVVFPGGTNDNSPGTQAIVDHFHLDDHVVVRYLHWLWDVVQGDFGRSINRGTPIVELIEPRLPISLQLVLVGVGLTVLVGIPLGVLAAAQATRGHGKLVNAVLGVSQSIPIFLTPIFLIWIFAIQLQWLPASGWVRISDSVGDNLKGLVLPAIALAFAEIGFVGRIVRGSVLEVLQTDYITAAAGKGLSSPYVLFRHALRPASLELLNLLALKIGSLLSGAVVIELVFGIGGLGQIVVEASLGRDLYLILGLTTYVVVVYVLLNVLVDALGFRRRSSYPTTVGRRFRARIELPFWVPARSSALRSILTLRQSRIRPRDSPRRPRR